MLYKSTSWKHGTFSIGNDLWRPGSATPLPKQGHLETQGRVQVGLGRLQRGKIHALIPRSLNAKAVDTRQSTKRTSKFPAGFYRPREPLGAALTRCLRP